MQAIVQPRRFHLVSWDGGIDALLALRGHGGGSVVAWLDDSAESSLCFRCMAAWPCATCPDPFGLLDGSP